MIKINSNCPNIVYSNDNTYNLPSVTGAIQWNGLTKKLEVSNGSTWLPIDNTVYLNTSEQMTRIIEWANKKISEEIELDRLAKENPAINDLVNQINEKKHQIEMVKTLIKKDRDFGETETQAYQAP